MLKFSLHFIALLEGLLLCGLIAIRYREVTPMIGFYDYTVILTYMGALAGMLGIVMSVRGLYVNTILCMAVALVCDTLDGIVARKKKNRTKNEMLFGIQIDSLCDLISFGLCPATLFYMLGMRGIADMSLLGAYCLCCVIRLGYFNVLAVQAELGTKGDYHGLPVVCLDIAAPAVYLAYLLVPGRCSLWVLRTATVLFGFLYILDFKVKKPVLWKFVAMGAAVLAPLLILLLRCPG